MPSLPGLISESELPRTTAPRLQFVASSEPGGPRFRPVLAERGATRHTQYVLSSVLYWIASAMCLLSICGLAFHIGNRARDFQYPIMRPCAESLLLHGAFQHALTVRAQIAVSADLA